jgi:hypothetical protein
MKPYPRSRAAAANQQTGPKFYIHRSTTRSESQFELQSWGRPWRWPKFLRTLYLIFHFLHELPVFFSSSLYQIQKENLQTHLRPRLSRLPLNLTIHWTISISMAPLALTALLALSSVSTIVTAYPLSGSHLSARDVPKCMTVPPKKLATTFCVGPYPNISDPNYTEGVANHPHPHHIQQCSEVLPEELASTFCVGPYPKVTQPITRRNPGDDQIVLPDWSEPVHRAWTGGNITEFCIRDGPKPDPNDIKKLCDNIDDDQIIARTMKKNSKEMDGDCFCKKFSHGTAWFKVCNCDRCDRLEIVGGLRDMCRATNELCASQGYSSSLLKLEDENGVLVQYNVEPKDAKSGKTDQDPIQAKPELTTSTCKSNDESKDNQEYTGPKIECWRSWKTLWLAHKCHDHSKDTATTKSEDYWHNAWVQKHLHDDLHSLIGKKEDAFTWNPVPPCDDPNKANCGPW